MKKTDTNGTNLEAGVILECNANDRSNGCFRMTQAVLTINFYDKLLQEIPRIPQ